MTTTVNILASLTVGTFMLLLHYDIKVPHCYGKLPDVRVHDVADF
jgi:hypothetical protein